ncbi:TetR/AcrR family transcriptional regulator [Cohnella abietis]|uniref:HTH tetR-type domain-containing protein n=1 Tax=Cohnella abietis TaxID=2507935 RepID=A0A3T1DCM2_9BACL|nr:TetR/AcrR family transcriptional regulator [Cohnella abietis]BBI35695.1 hypothetical protein KCTCHS21_50940 [Cohnella abietis]
MSITKQTIMDSAMRYFSEKGYAATSIQDIADDCGIAKGSLYKFFRSKEDLIIELHAGQQQALRDAVDKIRSDKSLNTREAFIRETEFHFEFFLQNKFIMRELKEISPATEKITQFLMHSQANLMSYCKMGLLEYLDEEVHPNIWDLAFMYKGIVREFIFFIVYDNKPLHYREVAEFIVDRMEDMAASMALKKPNPILHDAIMNVHHSCDKEDQMISLVELRSNLLESLSTTITELPITNFRKRELNDAVTLLRELYEEEQPNKVMLKALLNFIALEYQLKNIAKQLERITVKCDQIAGL